MPLGEWNRRLGALPAEAYHCFMVWVPWTQPITSVWRAGFACPQGRLAADQQSSRTPIAGPCRRVHVRQGQASGGAEEAAVLDRRCTRRLWISGGRGGRKPAARSNKRKDTKKGRKKEKVALRALDKKSPIQAVPRSPDHAAVLTSVEDKPPAGA